MKENQLQSFASSVARGEEEAVCHLKQAIAQGKHWYIALLEAIGLWNRAQETHNGRHYRYLIGDEAFDWLLLAERLTEEASSLIPEEELSDLLFFGKAPIEVSRDEFRRLIGDAKYGTYLNYFYGITVEEALLLAAEEEARKEQRVRVFNSNHPLDEAYQRLYGASASTLLKRFKKERGYPQRVSMGLSDLKEFTYWLFKHRLKHCDKALVASDTKKALEELQRQWSLREHRRGVGKPQTSSSPQGRSGHS